MISLLYGAIFGQIHFLLKRSIVVSGYYLCWHASFSLAHVLLLLTSQYGLPGLSYLLSLDLLFYFSGWALIVLEGVLYKRSR